MAKIEAKDLTKTAYTTTSAADVLRVSTDLLRFVIHQHRIPREQIGNQLTLSRDQILQLDQILLREDPDGLFRRRVQPHRGRPRANLSAVTS